MVFCILILLVVFITAFVSATSDVADTIGAFFASVVVGGLVLLIVCLSVSKATDVEHHDISVTNYTVAQGSGVKIDGTKLEFIYKDDKGMLKSYSDYAKKIVVSGTSGTVQVTETRYDLGTGVLPWGLDRVDTSAIVK